jgi:hypothetical protein
MKHACGHDGHTAMSWVGEIPKTRNLPGTAPVIFQPADEGLSGARHDSLARPKTAGTKEPDRETDNPDDCSHGRSHTTGSACSRPISNPDG